jgi:hypothetical protein
MKDKPVVEETKININEIKKMNYLQFRKGISGNRSSRKRR